MSAINMAIGQVEPTTISINNNMVKKLRLTPEHPLCYMHLPKTGGTTLRQVIARALPNEKFCVGVPNHVGPHWPISLEDGYTVFSLHLDKRFWDGREIFPQFITALRNPIDRMTSLYYFWRSYSYQNLELNSPLFLTPRFCKRRSFQAFVKSRNLGVGSYMFNSQARQLISGLHQNWEGTDDELLTEALKCLQQYELVGVTDRLEDMMAFFTRYLCGNPIDLPKKQNSNQSLKKRFPDSFTRKPESISQDLSDHILRLNLVDMVLYEWAKARWVDGHFKRSNDHGSDLVKALQDLQRLRSDLGVTTQSSQNYYSQGENFKEFTDWQMASTTSVGSVRLSYCQRQLRNNDCLQSGKLMIDIMSDEGEITQPLGSHKEISNLIGLFDAHKSPVEYLRNCVGDAITTDQQMCILEWRAGEFKSKNHQLQEFDTFNETHRDHFKKLYRQFRQDLNGYVYTDRSLEYLEHRYFKHPLKMYFAKIINDEQSGLPISIVFMTRLGVDLFIADFIGPFEVLNDSVAGLLERFDNTFKRVKMPLPEKVVSELNISSSVRYNTDFYIAASAKLLQTADHQYAYMTMSDSSAY